MKKYILLAWIGISTVCLGQENIYPLGQDSIAVPRDYVQVGDSVLFSFNVGTSWNSLFTSFQGILDLDGNLISYAPVAGLNGSMPQEFIGAYSQSRNDSSVFRSWNAFGVSGSITGGNRIDKYGVKTGHQDTFAVVGDSLNPGLHACTEMVDFGNTVWMGGSYSDSSFSGAYVKVFSKVDDDLLFRKYYPENNVIRDINKIGQDYVISFTGPGKILEVRDSTYQLDTAYIRPPSYPANQFARLYYEVHRIIDNPNSSKYYGLAYFVNRNIAMITYDKDHSITKIDSFLFAPTTEIRPGFFLNSFDYTSADSIFAVGNLWGAQYVGDGFDQPGRTEGFKVMMFDTANSIKWSKTIKNLAWFIRQVGF